MKMDKTRHRYRQYTTGTLPRSVEWVVGVDEVGRGPLAGPVTVGLVALPVVGGTRKAVPFDASVFSGVKDSKQLSSAVRERWHRRLVRARRIGALQFTVASSSNRIIDERGITFAANRAIARAFRRLAVNPESALILLDAGLSAPSEFKYQLSIVRGDENIPAIGLASIAAKVSRDRYMTRMARRHPEYGFERHKGYGTAFHRESLRRFGLCVLHRKSFIKA